MGQSGSRSAATLPPAVKVVHRGGRVERYYHTVTVDEVMRRNPRHFVALPDIFQSSKPAVLAPEVLLMPGRKVLLLPYRTVASLRRKYGMGVPPMLTKRSRVKSSAADESVSESVCPKAMRECRPGALAVAVAGAGKGARSGAGAAGKERDGKREAAVPKWHKARASCVGSPKVRGSPRLRYSPRRGAGGRTPSRSSRLQGKQRGRVDEAVVARRRPSPKVGGKLAGCGRPDGRKKEFPGKGGRESSAPADQSSSVLLVECAELPSPGVAGSKGSFMSKVYPVGDCQGQTCEGGDPLQMSGVGCVGQVSVRGRDGNPQSARLECCYAQAFKNARANEQVTKGVTVSINEVKDGLRVSGDEEMEQWLQEENGWESSEQNYLVQGDALHGPTNTAGVTGQGSSPLGNYGFDEDLFHYSSFVRSKIELFETLSQNSQILMSGKFGVPPLSPQAITTRVDSVKVTSLTRPSSDSLLDSVMDDASSRLESSVAPLPEERFPGYFMSPAVNQQTHGLGRDRTHGDGVHEQDVQRDCSFELSLPTWKAHRGFSAWPTRDGKRLQDYIFEPVRDFKTLQDLVVEPVRESKSLQDLILEDNQQYLFEPLDVWSPEKRKQEVKMSLENCISRVPVECSPDLFEIRLDPFLLPEEQACLERRRLKPELATCMSNGIARAQWGYNMGQAPVISLEGSWGKSLPARKIDCEASNTPVVELERPTQRSPGRPPRLKLRDHLKMRSPAREPEVVRVSTEVSVVKTIESSATVVSDAVVPTPTSTDGGETPILNEDENAGAGGRHNRKKLAGDSKQNTAYQLPKLPAFRRNRCRLWKPRLRTVTEGEVAIWSPIPHTFKEYRGVWS